MLQIFPLTISRCVLLEIKNDQKKGSLGKVESKIVGTEGSQLDIVGTVKVDMAFKGINTKQLFYNCNNLKQSALLGVNFLRDNGCVLDLSKGILHAGNTGEIERLIKLGGA